MKSLIDQLGESWFQQLKHEFNKPYMRQLQAFIRSKRQTTLVYPSPKQVFKAYRLTPYDQVKIVILGQD